MTLAWHQDQGFSDLNDGMHAPLLNYFGDYDLGTGQSLSLQMGFVGGARDSGVWYNPLSQPHDERVDSQFQQIDYRKVLSGGQELLVKAYHNDQRTLEDVPVGGPKEIIEFSGIYLLPAVYERDLKAERWHGEVQWNRPVRDDLRITLGGYGRRDAVNSQHYFNRSDDLVASSWGTFAHAEWRLTRNWLLNGGAMWEDHDLVGGRISPRVALTWQPNPRHSLRMGVSKAYRNPVQFEKNADWKLTLDSTVGPLSQAFYQPNDAIEPESNVSHEIGYLGTWPRYGLSADLRVYRDSLHDLVIRTGKKAPYSMANAGDSVHWGADGQLRWRLAPHSFVVLNYAYLHIDTSYPQTQYFPAHVGGLLFSHRFAHDIDVSVGHYRSDAFVTVSSDRPPKYRRLDIRIAKEFKLEGKSARLAYVMQHADGSDHEYDFDPDYPDRKRVSRQGYLQFQLEF